MRRCGYRHGGGSREGPCVVFPVCPAFSVIVNPHLENVLDVGDNVWTVVAGGSLVTPW